MLSRSTWACELKFLKFWKSPYIHGSRSTWACELKCQTATAVSGADSHAPRERVSWNTLQNRIRNWPFCHAPRERVSWNGYCCSLGSNTTCHAPRERVSWNTSITKLLRTDCSHAPRERVSWNTQEQTAEQLCISSRSTWACELKSKPVVICLNTPWGHAPRERVSWNNQCIGHQRSI